VAEALPTLSRWLAAPGTRGLDAYVLTLDACALVLDRAVAAGGSAGGAGSTYAMAAEALREHKAAVAAAFKDRDASVRATALDVL
jgi:hypothetical protein